MTTEDEILALSAARDAVLVTNDATAIAGFMTDDWVYVGPTGPTARADLIGWISTGRLAHDRMETLGQPRVAFYGDTVIVTAHKVSGGTWDGVAYTADEWISEVYLRLDGQWRCAFSQKCPAEG